MSRITDLASAPSWTVGKILIMGICSWSMLSTVMMSLREIGKVLATTGDAKMLFGLSVQPWILWLGLMIGVLSISAIGYWFKFQNTQKKKDVTLKFDVKTYGVSALMTITVSLLVAYIALFYALKYVMTETIIAEPELAFIVSMVIGWISAFVVDSVIFHPLADGTAAARYNKTQELVREQLASKEAQDALFSVISKKCEALGLVDPQKVALIAGMVKSEDDPQLVSLITLIKGTA